MKHIYISVLSAVLAILPASADTDYTKGVLLINENNFGTPSTISHLSPASRTDYFEYKIFQKANPDRLLGQTCDFGAYNNSLYVVAKQEKATNADTGSGLLTAIDPATMLWQWQLDRIDPSGKRAQGRAFIGISTSKGYISSSNGIWVVDLQNHKVTGQIAGTENPNGVDDKPLTDGTSSIYHGQSGIMVAAAGKIFAAHQSHGLQIINPETNTLEKNISMDFVAPGVAIGSIVADINGMLWLSIAQSEESYAESLDKLVKLNPSTLETEVIDLPTGIYGPSTSWASWTPDNFCASATEPYLFWSGHKEYSDQGNRIFRFNVATGEAVQLIAFDEETDLDIPWKLYGCSMRVNPADGTLFMSLFQDYSSTTYAVRTYTSAGELLRTYNMSKDYWFPAMFLFPESQLSGVESVSYTHATSPAVRIEGTRITVHGLAPKSIIYLYTLSGKLLATTESDSDGQASFTSPGAGFYLIHSPGTPAVKVAVQ